MDCQKCLNRNIIKSRLLFAMVLMTCCQPIRCLDLSYYAARLGITRTPTRKELMMIGTGMLLAVAAVYFLKRGWAAQGRGTASESVSSGLVSSSDITINGKVYTKTAWLKIIQEIPGTLHQDLLRGPTKDQAQHMTHIIQELDKIYQETQWPMIDIAISVETNKLIIASIIDALDTLYRIQAWPNIVDFHTWFFPLLEYDYTSSDEATLFIWHFVVYYAQLHLDVNKRFPPSFKEKAKTLLPRLKSTSFDSTNNTLREKVAEAENTYIRQEKNIALLIKLLDIMYALQMNPSIKNFHTVFIKQQSVETVKTKNDLIKACYSKMKGISKALHKEYERILDINNLEITREEDRDIIAALFDQLKKLTD